VAGELQLKRIVMHLFRLFILAISIILIFLASLQIYAAFHLVNVGPRLIADATMLTLGAIACIALFVKTGKGTSK
jgi:hypothetical protein